MKNSIGVFIVGGTKSFLSNSLGLGSSFYRYPKVVRRQGKPSDFIVIWMNYFERRPYVSRASSFSGTTPREVITEHICSGSSNVAITPYPNQDQYAVGCIAVGSNALLVNNYFPPQNFSGEFQLNSRP